MAVGSISLPCSLSTPGLRDIRVVGQVRTDLTFLAEYKMEGTGLSLLELSGRSGVQLELRELNYNFRLGGLEGNRHTDVDDQ